MVTALAVRLNWFGKRRPTGRLRSLAETCGDPGKSRVISERASRIGGGVRLHIPATAVQQMTNTLPDRTHTHGVCPLWYSVLQPPHGALPPAVSPKRPNKAAPVTPRGDLPYQSDISEDHTDTSRNACPTAFISPPCSIARGGRILSEVTAPRIMYH